jgi:CRP-like cAMP-binding protein
MHAKRVPNVRACSAHVTHAPVVLSHIYGVSLPLINVLQCRRLAALEGEEIKQLAEAMELVEFTDGEYIVERGAPADALFLLLAGEVACTKGVEGSDELRLAEGTLFGESCLSSATVTPRREANVVAVGAVRCAKLCALDVAEIVGSISEAIERAFCRKVIDSIDIFAALLPEEKRWLVSALTSCTISANQVVIPQGAEGDTFYIIKHGEVEVRTTDEAGEVSKTATLTSGSYFGERTLADTIDLCITSAPMPQPPRPWPMPDTIPADLPTTAKPLPSRRV